MTGAEGMASTDPPRCDSVNGERRCQLPLVHSGTHWSGGVEWDNIEDDKPAPASTDGHEGLRVTLARYRPDDPWTLFGGPLGERDRIELLLKVRGGRDVYARAGEVVELMPVGDARDLRAALGFYADPLHWGVNKHFELMPEHRGEDDNDGGERARKALRASLDAGEPEPTPADGISGVAAPANSPQTSAAPSPVGEREHGRSECLNCGKRDDARRTTCLNCGRQMQRVPPVPVEGGSPTLSQREFEEKLSSEETRATLARAREKGEVWGVEGERPERNDDGREARVEQKSIAAELRDFADNEITGERAAWVTEMASRIDAIAPLISDGVRTVIVHPPDGEPQELTGEQVTEAMAYLALAFARKASPPSDREALIERVRVEFIDNARRFPAMEPASRRLLAEIAVDALAGTVPSGEQKDDPEMANKEKYSLVYRLRHAARRWSKRSTDAPGRVTAELLAEAANRIASGPPSGLPVEPKEDGGASPATVARRLRHNAKLAEEAGGWQFYLHVADAEKIAKVLDRVDAQSEGEDGYWGGVARAVAKQRDQAMADICGAERERDEALAEVERLEAREAKQLVEYERLRAAKPLSTELLRDPSGELVRSLVKLLDSDPVSVRDAIERIADHCAENYAPPSRAGLRDRIAEMVWRDKYRRAKGSRFSEQPAGVRGGCFYLADGILAVVAESHPPSSLGEQSGPFTASAGRVELVPDHVANPSLSPPPGEGDDGCDEIVSWIATGFGPATWDLPYGAVDWAYVVGYVLHKAKQRGWSPSPSPAVVLTEEDAELIVRSWSDYEVKEADLPQWRAAKRKFKDWLAAVSEVTDTGEGA